MPGLTRTACKTRARYLLAEPTARWFTEDTLNAWVNDAVRDISIKTFCNTIIATSINTVANCAEYTWPVTLNTSGIATLGVKAIINSSNISMIYVTPDQIGRVATSGWDNTRWTSWYERVIFSPPPPTGHLTVTMYIWTEGRQTASGSINLPNAYHHLVPLYVTYLGWLKKKEIELATSFYTMYQEQLNHIASVVHPLHVPVPMKNALHDQANTP